MYTAYKNNLSLKPVYARPIAHHVTEKFGTDTITSDLISDGWQAIATTELAKNGVHCYVVTFVRNGSQLFYNGNRNRYHITVSLAEGKKPVQSNDLINEFESEYFDPTSFLTARSCFIPLDLSKAEVFE